MLLLLGLRLGCEMIDVEHSLPLAVRRVVVAAAKSRAVVLRTKSLKSALASQSESGSTTVNSTTSVFSLLPAVAWKVPTIIWSKHFPKTPQPDKSSLKLCMESMREDAKEVDTLVTTGARLGCADVIKIVTRASSTADVDSLREASEQDARAEARDYRDLAAKAGSHLKSHRDSSLDLQRAFAMPGLWAEPL